MSPYPRFDEEDRRNSTSDLLDPPAADPDSDAGWDRVAGDPAERPWERARRRRREAGRTHIRSIRFLRAMAVAEATAFLALLTAAVAHAVTGGFGMTLFVLGNVHGAVFTTYLVSIFIFRAKVGWGPVMLLLVLLAGFIPGGGLMVERWALAAPGRDV